MASISLRTRAPILRLRTIQSARRTIAQPHALYSVLVRNPCRDLPRYTNSQSTQIHNPLQFPLATPQSSTIPMRTYSTTAPPKPTADALIEELQDLYEIAKDEFEIATDSTDGATIYAASDRESARDALNQLCAVYYLYTARPGEDADSGIKVIGGETEGKGVSDVEKGTEAVVETNFNPEDVGSDVRDEVRRRVGQRVRELRNAVEVLEDRAHAE